MHVECEPSSFFTDSCDALLFEYIHQFQKDPSNLRCLSFSLLSTVVGENSESQVMKPTAIWICCLKSFERGHKKIAVSSLAMAPPTMTIIKVTKWAKGAVVFYPRT